MTPEQNKKLLRVGMAQVNAELGNLDTNIQKAINLIEANRGKLDLLVFPELSLTGYSIGDRFHECAMRLDDSRFKKLIKATTDLTVAVGMIEETPSFKFYNSLVFIKNGEVIHTHRKIYLPNYDIFEEKKYFATGTKYNSFDHGHFRIGPLVCGDAWNPALVHLAAADEANLMVISACSPDREFGGRLSNKKNWHRLIRFYATMYGSYVVFVNRTGSERGLSFYGTSTLINPFGEVVSAAKDNEEGVITGVINLGLVRKARTLLNTIRDENLDFIQKELGKIINNKDYL